MPPAYKVILFRRQCHSYITYRCPGDNKYLRRPMNRGLCFIQPTIAIIKTPVWRGRLILSRSPLSPASSALLLSLLQGVHGINNTTCLTFSPRMFSPVSRYTWMLSWISREHTALCAEFLSGCVALPSRSNA